MISFYRHFRRVIDHIEAAYSSATSQSKGCALTGAAILVLLLAEGCASIGNPSGGPRDERPPRFVKADPAPGSVNIRQDRNRIRIDFDELVEVKDPTTKVIISPPGGSIPRVAAQGHHVDVTFQDSLLPNTTYTIDFADAIQDINEGNPIANFAYTFSTGPTLDSLRIAGRVISAHEMEPMQLKLVGLHRLGDEETPPETEDHKMASDFSESLHKALFSKKFDRVARTDDRGQFSIEGLAPGRYRIYALDDTNSDYIFSNADEEVAFSDVVLSPSTSTATAVDSIYNLKTGQLDTVLSRRRTIYLPNDVLLRSFLSRRKNQYIENYNRTDSTRLNLIFHAPADSMPRINIVGIPPTADAPYVTERSRGNDTISLWLRSPALIAADTLRLSVEYLVLDSLQRYVSKTDTLRFTTDRAAIKKAQDAARKLIEKQKKQIKKQDKDADDEATAAADSVPPIPLLSLAVTPAGAPEIGRPLYLTAGAPIARVDTTAFRLETKVDTLWQSAAPPRILFDSLNPRQLILEMPLKLGSEYRLTVDSLAIESIYGLHNARLEHDFRLRNAADYCSLTLRLTDWPADLPAFVELLNSSDRPAAVANVADGAAVFPYLAPGKYYARIINDLNANGQWDSGDPLISLQAEESYYYPKAINIKKNWNKDESWSVFATPADAMKPLTLLKNKPAQSKKGRQSATPKEQDDDEEEDF